MPDSGAWVGHFVGHEPNSVVCRVRLVLVHRGACPGHDGRLHSQGATDTCKCEGARAAADSKLAIGDVVVHVALPGMGLTPGIFARGDVLCFRKIGRSRILRWIQVAHCHRDSMRRSGVTMAVVIVRRVRRRAGWEKPGKRIYPRA